VVGPAGIPGPVVRQLNDTLNTTLQVSDMAEKLSAEAVSPMPMSSEEFGKYIQAEVVRWTAVAKERNIQVED
jgi:tripartite-type tricarboxylate transporter receptor subunit TctC